MILRFGPELFSIWYGAIYWDGKEIGRPGLGQETGNQKYILGYIKFEMTTRCPFLDVMWLVGYMILMLRRDCGWHQQYIGCIQSYGIRWDHHRVSVDTEEMNDTSWF